MRRGVVTLVVVACCVCGFVASGAPGGGRLPGAAYQEILHHQTLAPSENPAPSRQYVLVSSQPLGAIQMAELTALGLTIVASSGGFTVVKASLTAYAAFGPDSTALAWVQSVLPSVSIESDDGTSASFPSRETPDVSPLISGLSMQEVFHMLGADTLHQNDVKGSGVGIAVLDWGFTGRLGDMLPEGQVQYLKVVWTAGQNPELAEGYTPDGYHGEACAEALAALAPEAKYYLISLNNPADRLAVLGFLSQKLIDVEIVSDSTYWPIPMDHNDGRGELAASAARLMEQGIAYFKSVGNFADTEDTKRTVYSGVFTDADGDSESSHDFRPSAAASEDRNTLPIVIGSDEEIEAGRFSTSDGTAQLRLVLEWDGWPWQVRDGAVWTQESIVSIQDLDLGLFYQFNDGSTAPVVRTMTDQLRTLTTTEPPPQPIEILSEGKDKDYLVLSRPGTYLVRIWNETQRSKCGDCQLFERPAEFHLYIYTNGTTFSLEEPSQASSAGCLINEAAGNVISIGAVGYTGKAWCAMPYSSLGPTDDGRMKPDFVSPTGYESQAWGGYLPGTSAATPLAAGVAALALSNWPDLTLEELVSAMTNGAIPLCGTLEEDGACEEGHTSNNVVGHGLLTALGMFEYLAAPTPVTPSIPTPVPGTPCQEVARWSGNEAKQTETFSIQGSRWRISWKTTQEYTAGSGILIVHVYDASGAFVSTAAAEQGIGSGVSYVNAQPELFYLEISSSSVDWEVVVEDCTD